LLNTAIKAPPLPSSSGKKSEILYGAKNAVGRGVNFMSNVKQKMDICFDHRAPSIVIAHKAYQAGYIDIRKRGGKIRALTEITPENTYYCKEIMKIVNEFRHLDGLKGGIAVSESEYMATTVLEEAKPLTQVIYSNAKEIVEQGQFIFDILWSKGIQAKKRIKEIEEGAKREFIETIQDPIEIHKVTFSLLNSATEEILIIFSTANAFRRQERAGMLRLLNELAEKGIGIKTIQFRILIPADDSIRDTIAKSTNPKIHIRFIEPALQTRVTILLIDRRFSLTIEVKDDTKRVSNQAIGLATYSNSESTVLSYISIFEALWMQTELYEQLKEHERMEKEFIDIAAHELRTPLQSIISYNALALKDLIDKDEAMGVIDKQARRLHKLASDLLAVSRIESGSLSYKMEKIKINDILLDVINSLAATTKANHDQLDKREEQISIKTELESTANNIEIDADKDRITEALYNIIDNAIKFTPKGIIKVEDHVYLDKNKIEIKVSDTGSGIPKDILPKLFGKFVTRSVRNASQHGTGLGLFITKAIVTAHNGQITAFNNNRGGATFTIVLPIYNDDSKDIVRE
jgi:two-component system, OmpR family, sensor histidine kinase VicK